jgi:hypothetical protein
MILAESHTVLAGDPRAHTLRPQIDLDALLRPAQRKSPLKMLKLQIVRLITVEDSFDEALLIKPEYRSWAVRRI